MLESLIIELLVREKEEDLLLVEVEKKLSKLESDFEEELRIYKKLLTEWTPSKIVEEIIEKKLKELGIEIRQLKVLKKAYIRAKEEMEEEGKWQAKSRYNIYKMLLEREVNKGNKND